MKHKQLKIWGVLFCGSAVILGAFGAHLLSDILSPGTLQSFEVATRHQFFHGMALLFLSLTTNSQKFIYKSGQLFIIGVLLFSISIYLLSLSTLYAETGMTAILAPVTPVGGLMLILGWMNLLVGFLRD